MCVSLIQCFFGVFLLREEKIRVFVQNGQFFNLIKKIAHIEKERGDKFGGMKMRKKKVPRYI